MREFLAKPIDRIITDRPDRLLAITRPVPEPSVAWMMALGLGGGALVLRRRPTATRIGGGHLLSPAGGLPSLPRGPQARELHEAPLARAVLAGAVLGRREYSWGVEMTEAGHHLRTPGVKPGTGRRTWGAAFALAVSLSAAISCSASLAAGTASGAAKLKAVAASIDGRLIIAGTTFYRVSRVHSIDDSEGTATLHAEGDPLLEGKYSNSPDGNQDGRLYYDVSVAEKATCGVPGASTSVNTSNFLIFHKGQFVTLADAFKDVPIRSSDRPINRVPSAVLARVETCAKQMASLADAMPFRSIGIYAGEQLITEVARTFTSASTHEESPGDDLISKMSHVTVSTKDGKALEDFEVRVRAVSVMHCDYEGPHLELDGWKKGLGPEIRLERQGQKFLIGADVLAEKMPSFPAYTGTELRQAIARQFGNTGMATKEEAKPCAPMLRGYRFTIRYRSRVVQEIIVAYAGGC